MTAVFAKISSESASASASVLSFVNFSQVVFYLFNFLFFLYFAFLWWFLVVWVGEDARQRGLSEAVKKRYQGLTLFLSLPGLFLYFLMRPRQTVEEKKRAEMEEEILKLELEKLRRESK